VVEVVVKELADRLMVVEVEPVVIEHPLVVVLYQV
jgi:hypothetical protein